MERRLARGLDALLGKGRPEGAKDSGVEMVPVREVRANPRQPRKAFDPERDEQLRESISRSGLLQPIVVQRTDTGYELIAGERRLRACKSLGIEQVPAVIRSAGSDQKLVLALVENLQRAQLGPIEEAEAFRALQDEFGLSHGEIAEQVGRERSTVANTMRLLDLPPLAREAVSRGTLSAGHGRALLPFATRPDFDAILTRVLDEGWTVRQVEAFGKEPVGSGAAAEDPNEPLLGAESAGEAASAQKTPAIRDLEDRLKGKWGVVVDIRVKRRGGTILFHCASKNELNYLLEQLEGS